MKTRTRFLLSGNQHAEWFFNNRYSVNRDYPVNAVVTDTLTSEGNFWPPPKRLRKYDAGNGRFVAISYDWQGTGNVSASYSQNGLGGADRRMVAGLLLPESPSVPVPIVPSNALLDALGTQGFRATIPTKPMQSAAVFAGELRQLPTVSPTALKIMRDRAWKYVQSWRAHVRKAPKYTQSVADDFLNQQFGWLPFLRDIDSLLTPRVKLLARVNQLERDSGKRVRRRRQLTNEISTTPMVVNPSGGYGYPTGLSAAQLVTSQGTKLSTSTTRETAWFSACYTYHIESKTHMMGIPHAIQMARLIHGLSINPEVLWNLSPWSWLADYGANYGSILSNLSAFSSDNLVAVYAYVMVKTEVSRDVALVGIGLRGGGSISTFSQTKATCKRRVRGLPYGFGFAGPLTGKQTAILVALGLSNGLK